MSYCFVLLFLFSCFIVAASWKNQVRRMGTVTETLEGWEIGQKVNLWWYNCRIIYTRRHVWPSSLEMKNLPKQIAYRAVLCSYETYYKISIYWEHIKLEKKESEMGRCFHFLTKKRKRTEKPYAKINAEHRLDGKVELFQYSKKKNPSGTWKSMNLGKADVRMSI